MAPVRRPLPQVDSLAGCIKAVTDSILRTCPGDPRDYNYPDTRARAKALCQDSFSQLAPTVPSTEPVYRGGAVVHERLNPWTSVTRHAESQAKSRYKKPGKCDDFRTTIAPARSESRSSSWSCPINLSVEEAPDLETVFVPSAIAAGGVAHASRSAVVVAEAEGAAAATSSAPGLIEWGLGLLGMVVCPTCAVSVSVYVGDLSGGTNPELI